jgi:hypothetical protein
VGDRVDNLFIAEFGGAVDKKKVLDGSPWVVVRYAIILQDYDETLKPSDISFIKVPMWVRILDLPFGWMNSKRGSQAACLIGEVMKIDADAEGKSSGLFLRARITVDVSKPLRRGIMLKKDKFAARWNGLNFSMRIFLFLFLLWPYWPPRNFLPKPTT